MHELVLDLHLHSRFSRAVSPRMNLANMYLWGRKKGIHILTTSDFTHPVWFQELKAQLEEVSEGIYGLKDKKRVEYDNSQFFPQNGGLEDALGPYFMLSCEVAAIYSENGNVHKIHTLIFAPNIEIAAKINTAFRERGFNLASDGRPILGISSRNLAEMLFEIDPKIVIIPCHIWTPWFSLYGSRSGYDHIFDCFGEYAPRIFAVESGLSSDPAMNWRIKELVTRSIVSFSDAHSLEKMGREATVLRLKGENSKSKIQNSKISLEDITYSNIINGFVRGKERVFEIAYTIEFYPEEGKYHYSGHRNCEVSYSPREDKEKGTLCPVCHRPLTIGVMSRVEELASFPEANLGYEADSKGVVWVKDPKHERAPYVALVPLLEVLSEALGSGLTSQAVITIFDRLVSTFTSEHTVLFRTPLEDIRKLTGEKIASGIEKVRARDIRIKPGFDGEYGMVSIWNKEESSERE